MAGKTLPQLPKPRTLLGWGMLAAATALVKEKYTDLTWGEVALAPVQGILNAYNDPKSSGWRKAWNVAIETTKLGAGIALMAGATVLATAVAPAVAATVAGGLSIAAGGLVAGGAVSHFIIDPLLDKAKVRPLQTSATSQPAAPAGASSYASLVDRHQSPAVEITELSPAPAARQHITATAPTSHPKIIA